MKFFKNFKVGRKFISYLLLSAISFQSLTAQPTGNQGYAVYNLLNGYNNETIDFWFTDNIYIYKFRIQDFRESSDYKNMIKTMSKKDSLAFENVVNNINKKNKELPTKYIFGALNKNFTMQKELRKNLTELCVIDTLQFIKWEVLPDTLTINGLLCRKANGYFGSMKYIAWFAPSIPVSVAPMQLRGLPGLLVKLNNLNTHAQVMMTYLEWPSRIMINATSCSIATAIGRAEFIAQEKVAKEQKDKQIRNAKTVSDLLNSIEHE